MNTYADEGEQAFFEWWDKNEPYKDMLTLRMAFDAGYLAAKEQE